jgi:hypothetical protein
MPQLTKVKFRNTDESNEYLCLINPSSVEMYDDYNINTQNILDGCLAISAAGYDNRIRVLQWQSFATDDQRWTSMATELRSYSGKKKQINLGTIDVANRGWKDIQVVNVSTKILDNEGKVRYSLILEYIYKDRI